MNFWTIFTAVLLSGCIQLTPKQESLFYAPGPDQYITAAEIRELLPDFAIVADGQYQLVPRGKMPTALWCNPYASDLMSPMGWDCVKYTEWAVAEMKGYACGELVREGNPRHMQMICIDIKNKSLIFEPQTCQWDWVYKDQVLSIEIKP